MRLRIIFAKTKAMRYTGHLDVQRALERTLRRASLPLAYTQGFSPHARINLASALPLGFTSEGEIVDIWLEKEMPLDQIQTALDTSVPPGIEIRTIEEIITKEPALQAQVQAAEYIAWLSEPVDGIKERLASLMASESLPRERRGKSYDLRPLVESLDYDKKDNQDRIIMRLSARERATGRPEEVLDVLGIPLENATIQRTSILF
ncbi:MAG: TIGR03936 family radical SAM-associated protein [Chloroflexota bacterium]